MNKCIRLTLFFAMILCFLPKSNAFVVDVKPAAEKTTSAHFSKELNSKNYSKRELRKFKRQARKAKRVEKRLAKFQRKWEMKTAKKDLKNKKRRRFFGGVTDDNRFRLGVILVVASLLIGILARVPLFGGLFGILSGLSGLIGLIFILLALLDYY